LTACLPELEGLRNKATIGKSLGHGFRSAQIVSVRASPPTIRQGFKLGVARFQIKGLLPPEVMPQSSVKDLPKDAKVPLDYGSIRNQIMHCAEDIFNANGIVE